MTPIVVNIRVEVVPFIVPSGVAVKATVPSSAERLVGPLSGQGLSSIVGLKLEELLPEDLSNLCNQFRKDVFEKAGKADPLLPVKRDGS